MHGVIAGHDVALVAAGIDEGAIGIRALIGEECLAIAQRWTVSNETAISVERSALKAGSQQIGQAFLKTDVNDTQTGEVPVFGAEWPIENVYIVDQFRSQSFERPEIALAMPLGALVLLDIIHQDFQAAVDSAVIEVETETPDLKRFPAAFVLTGIDAPPVLSG